MARPAPTSPGAPSIQTAFLRTNSLRSFRSMARPITSPSARSSPSIRRAPRPIGRYNAERTRPTSVHSPGPRAPEGSRRVSSTYQRPDLRVRIERDARVGKGALEEAAYMRELGLEGAEGLLERWRCGVGQAAQVLELDPIRRWGEDRTE